MAENRVTTSADVPLETDDDLSETQLRKYLAQGNAANYVEQGCGFAADFNANTLDIGTTSTRGNFVLIEHNNLLYPLFPPQETGISLPATSGTNHVFVTYDPSNETTEYVVNDTGSTPSNATLKIGEVDTANNTTTELNRAPSATFRGIDIDQTNTYSLSNVTTDRTFDADSTTTAELADVLGTLIQDLGVDD